MQTGLRKLLLSSLVLAFCGQTAMVYLDPTADRTPPLSELALAGRKLWHEKNCQVCHQIYGFGGFLGPDLTNAAPRLTRTRLDEILTKGNGQMPAFGLNAQQIDSIAAFLAELDKTGVGVAQKQSRVDPAKVYAAIEQRLPPAEVASAEHAGLATFRSLCAACHVPLQSTALGQLTAPDLTTAITRLGEDAVRQTIQAGRVERGMPAWNLPAQQLEEISALLRWLTKERAALAEAVPETTTDHGLPWWEFAR
ncbi:MAG: c-type cytochrome [Planctomycetota bacterium]